MPKLSQFTKIILLIVLSIGLFLGLKTTKILPERLFSADSKKENPSMLIDSVLLEALGGGSLVQVDLTDTILPRQDLIEGGQNSLGENINDTMAVLMVDGQGSHPVVEIRKSLEIKPYIQSNFVKRLERRKPKLHYPEEDTYIVTEKSVTDTLLDPTLSIQGYGYLQRFYSKLVNLENGEPGKARVAYFGDSMNDGDLIVQDFRSMIQDEFGGFGVGFVSITSMSAGSRGSVYHKHSDNWHTQSFVSVRRPTSAFGVDGQVFLANDAGNYWASYTAGNAKNSPALYSPTLFYGNSENQNGFVSVKINNGTAEKKELIPEYAVNTLNLGSNHAKSVQVNFSNIKGVPIYGLNFSSFSGVHVDNFSLRGNSGLTLAGFNTGLMNAFDRVLNYDLVILHFGTNVLNYGSLDYTFYENSMTAVINKLRYCFPNADILVISTADKASKINMQMVTDPAVMSLVKAQKRFSRDTGVGFVDLYSLMGGNGSMVEWVNKQLANKDYTHFNIKGSKEIGTLLYNEVHKGYEKYKNQLDRDKKRQENIN